MKIEPIFHYSYCRKKLKTADFIGWVGQDDVTGYTIPIIINVFFDMIHTIVVGR